MYVKVIWMSVECCHLMCSMKHLQQKVHFSHVGLSDYRSTKNSTSYDLETFIKLGMVTFIFAGRYSINGGDFRRITFVIYGVSEVP